jgi:hypothetical protein
VLGGLEVEVGGAEVVVVRRVVEEDEETAGAVKIC